MRRDSFARLRADRVVELQVRRLVDADDMELLNYEVTTQIQRAGREVVICSDCRFASPVSHEVARVWARAMRQNNREILRSAIVLDPRNTMINLQLERVVRCAIHPGRRLFDDPIRARDWLGASLSEPEREALRELFVEGAP